MWRQRSILGWRQEHVEFQASLGYPARLCLKTKQSWDLNNSHSGRTCCCLLSLPVSHLACLEHSKLASSIVGASLGSVHLQLTPFVCRKGPGTRHSRESVFCHHSDEETK